MKHKWETICAIFIFLCLLSLPSYSAEPKFARFFAACYGSRYSDKDFKEMAKKLDLVILDSYNYPKPPAILKDTKKDIIILAYMNALDVHNMEEFSKRTMREDSKVYRMYKEWEDINFHEDWLLHDKNGKRVKVFMQRKEERFGLNLGNKGLQEFFSKQVTKLTDNGYDGVFFDNVWVSYPFGPKMLISFSSATPVDMDEGKWWEDNIAFLKAIKKAIGKKIVVFNQVRGNDPENSLKYLNVSDGAMDENWISNGKFDFNDFIEGTSIISLINKKNRMSLPIALGQKESEALTLYCSYLLVKDGDNAFFSYMKEYTMKGMNWYPFYEIDLGSSKGDYYRQDGLFLRKFANGLIVVNPNLFSAKTVLPEEYKSRDGEKIKEVILNARGGDIFLKKDVTFIPTGTKSLEFFSFDTPLDFTKESGSTTTEGKMKISIDIDIKMIKEASILLSIFDADNPSEGKVFINGNGPIELPWGRGKEYNWKEYSFDPIPVEKDWIVKGENEVKFVKNKGGDFKVIKVSLRLEYESNKFPQIREIEKKFLCLSADLDFTRDNVPEQKVTAVYIDKDTKDARTAFIILTLFDADNPDEGEFFINGKGPIPLPEGRGKDFNWKDYTFDPIPIDKSWLKKGWNGIRFKKKTNGSFKVSSVVIKIMFAEGK